MGDYDPNIHVVNYCEFAGVKTPGLAWPESAALINRWEEQKGHGFNGSGLVFSGNDLCPFDVVIELYNSQDWKDWHAFRAAVIPSPTPDANKAIAFWHPLTAEIGINSVVILEVGQAKHMGKGLWQRVIKVKEFRAPTPKPVSKAKSATASRQGQTVVDDPYDTEIRKLTGQVQELA